jgi:Spy/CpxP family protein refolding chaperone
MNMKKIIVFSSSVLIMLIFTISAFAQQGGGRGSMTPQEIADRQTNQMKETLVLTAEQLPKIEALNLTYAEKMVTAREAADGDRESMRDTFRAMMKEKDVTLKEILTSEQWTKLEAWRKEARENGQRRRGI